MPLSTDESLNESPAYIWSKSLAQGSRREESAMLQSEAKNHPPLSLMGSLYITLSAIGALVGVFVAGMLVALEEARLSGQGRIFTDLELAGVGVGMVAGGAALGVFVAVVFRTIRWAWH